MPILSDPFGRLFQPNAKKTAQTEAFLRLLTTIDCSLVFDASHRKEMYHFLQRRPQGLYLQLRTNGTVYIGKASDLYRRTLDHQEDGIRLSYLAFLTLERTVSAQELNDAETELIALALRESLSLDNISKLQIAQERNRQQWEDDCLQLFPSEKIESWFTEKFFSPAQSTASFSRLYQQASHSERRVYEQCQHDPVWMIMFPHLHRFVSSCLPLHRDLFLRRWSLAVALDGDLLLQKAHIYAGAQCIFSLSVKEDNPDVLACTLLLSSHALRQFWPQPQEYFDHLGISWSEQNPHDALNDSEELWKLGHKRKRKDRQEFFLAAMKPWSQGSHLNYFTLTADSDRLKELLVQDEILFAASMHALSAMRFSGSPPRGNALLALSII